MEEQWPNYDKTKCSCGRELGPEDHIFCKECREALETIAEGGAGS